MSDQPPKAISGLPKFVEFVALIALMMGMTALSIDIFLPAFPSVQAHFGIEDPNQLQLLVYVYMIGFALMQLVYGPLSDVIGRRPVVMLGIGVYIVGCGVAIFASTFSALLFARVVQGMGAAAARVLAVAIVRDCFAGREMARVLSIIFAVFIIVPVFAPAIGGIVLIFGEWQVLFASMLALAVVLAVWFGLRMPETLHPEYRLPFSTERLLASVRLTLTTRVTVGYSTAVALIFGCLMAYVGSAQQIFETEVYALGPLFTVVFGAIATTMAVGAVLNAHLVRRLGMRRLSHAATLGFVTMSVVQCALALLYDGRPPLLAFCLVLAGSQFFASIAISNFNAMAMEPLGAVAGTASSFLGFYTTLFGALIGLLIGHWFNGTVVPLGIGYLALSVSCLLVVLWTERGVLFRPYHPDPVGR